MSDETSSEREKVLKGHDDEVEGHAAVKAHIKATDEPGDEEPDVEGHMVQKTVQKKFEK